MFSKTETSLKFSIFILGFTAIITQVILLREFLSVFYGNELVIGIILANWMLLTSLGAYLGKFFNNVKEKLNVIVPSQLLLGILPLLIVFAIHYLKNRLLPPGKLVSLNEIVISSLILLSLFCIISGALFTIFSVWFSGTVHLNSIDKVYSWEAVGGILGGLLVNLLLFLTISTFYCLTILIMINYLAASHLLYISGRKSLSVIFSVLAVFFTTFILISDINSSSIQFLYPGQEVIYSKDTPYGNLAVTKYANQFNFYENGIPLFSSDNTISNEESVHYAMVQHANPHSILLISGGISGTLKEILKYPVESVDYLEINPALIEIGKNYTSNILNDNRIRIINEDARLYIKKTHKKYDIVLINLPDPSNAEINRYYTLEFFEELKKHLNKFAVISTSLMPTNNYVSEVAAEIHSSLYSTLKLLFQNVIIIPGGRNYFLASERYLSYNITQLIESKAISTEYVNIYYLNDDKIKQESLMIEDAISKKIEINYDLKPTTYLLQLKLWLNQFTESYIPVGLLLMLPLIIIFLKFNIFSTGLFVTGFSSLSLEVIIIIAFQVIYGYVFQMLGLIIAFFMAGLAIGSYYFIKKLNYNFRSFSLNQYLIGIFALLLPLFIVELSHFSENYLFINFVFIVLILIIGIITGVQFALTTKIRNSDISTIASESYSSELLGSALGALVVTTFLIPYFGIIKVSLMIGIVNIVTGLLILLSKKDRLSM